MLRTYVGSHQTVTSSMLYEYPCDCLHAPCSLYPAAYLSYRDIPLLYALHMTSLTSLILSITTYSNDAIPCRYILELDHFAYKIAPRCPGISSRKSPLSATSVEKVSPPKKFTEAPVILHVVACPTPSTAPVPSKHARGWMDGRCVRSS